MRKDSWSFETCIHRNGQRTLCEEDFRINIMCISSTDNVWPNQICWPTFVPGAIVRVFLFIFTVI